MYASPEVRRSSADRCVVLMDRRACDPSVLDTHASRMWQLLLTETARQRIGLQSLAMELQVPVATLESDLQVFREDCCKKGLLLEHPHPALPQPLPRVRAQRKPIRPSYFSAWWVLATTALRLRRQGFARTYQHYAQLEKASASADANSDARLRLLKAVQKFRKAENFFISPYAPRDCLPRSLALYRFLVEMGLPASHCISVQRAPFEAHAWVECFGETLFNHPQDLAGYSELARI